MSYLDQYVDYEKLKKIILDELSLKKMCPEDFEEYRMLLFHTSISVLDKAIAKSQYGQKSNKLEQRYLQEVTKNIN